MADINMKWIGGEQFLGSDGAGHVVVTDPNGQGFKPTKLLLVSLVGCAGVDVVRILEKKRQKATAIEAQVSMQHDTEPPWCIERIDIEWVVRGTDLREKPVTDAIRLSEEKYCSVYASLTSEIVSTVRVVNKDDTGSA
jgi:putative redox protein